MLAMFAIAVFALVAVVLILAAAKSDTFRVQHTAAVRAAPDKIFPHINDFRKWQTWSPFEKLDSGMKKTYTGATEGNGAIYEWEGNAKAGKGRMEITESSPPGKISIKLDFIKPFAGHNLVEFTMLPNGASTELTWAMRGSASFTAKLMHLFINMDKMIGKKFEVGLANLKAIAEK